MPVKGPNPFKLIECPCGWTVQVPFKPATAYMAVTDYTCVCGIKYQITDYMNGITTYYDVAAFLRYYVKRGV